MYNKPMPAVSPEMYNKPMPAVSPEQYMQPMPQMMPMMCCPFLMSMQCPMMMMNPMMNAMPSAVSPAMMGPNSSPGMPTPYDMGYMPGAGQYQYPMSGM
jgi:hypothetical protein